MKILYTATSYPPAVGGAQLHLHALVQRVRQSSEVRVLCQWNWNRTDWLLGTTLRAPTESEEYALDGVKVRRLALGRAERGRLALWVALFYLLQGPAIRALARPWMEQIREEAARFDIVHNSRMGREPFSFASYAAARSVGMPFLLTPNHHFRWRGFWYRHYQELYRLADGIIALTQAEKRSLEQMGVDGRRITVTGIGPILAERAEPDAFRREAGIGERFVLFVGQKFRYKNLRSLLDAARLVWSRYPNVRFVFLGPRTEYSQRLFRAVKDARILEKDTVSLQVKANAMAACEVLCLPSLQESFGGVFVEAWMMGKPVVGCDIPAVREVITSGVDGIVAKPTADSLAEAIVHLLDHPDQAREMGERGREKALRRFTWEALARKTEEAYGRALHR